MTELNLFFTCFPTQRYSRASCFSTVCSVTSIISNTPPAWFPIAVITSSWTRKKERLAVAITKTHLSACLLAHLNGHKILAGLEFFPFSLMVNYTAKSLCEFHIFTLFVLFCSGSRAYFRGHSFPLHTEIASRHKPGVFTS